MHALSLQWNIEYEEYSVIHCYRKGVLLSTLMVRIMPFTLLHVVEDNVVKNYFISFDIDDKGILGSFHKSCAFILQILHVSYPLLARFFDRDSFNFSFFLYAAVLKIMLKSDAINTMQPQVQTSY